MGGSQLKVPSGFGSGGKGITGQHAGSPNLRYMLTELQGLRVNVLTPGPAANAEVALAGVKAKTDWILCGVAFKNQATIETDVTANLNFSSDGHITSGVDYSSYSILLVWFSQGNSSTLATTTSTTTTTTTASSKKFKKDIKAINGEANRLMKLKPVSFHYKPECGIDGLQFGLIAEEVAEVYPNIVQFSGDEAVGIQYHHLIPLLIAQIQVLNDKLAALAPVGV
jgi:hypothetical protein